MYKYMYNTYDGGSDYENTPVWFDPDVLVLPRKIF